MNASHIKKIALVFVVQIMTMGCGILWKKTTFNWLSDTFFICAFIIPLAGYVVALYRAPIFESVPSALKMAFLGAFSFFATLGGLVIIGIAFIGVMMMMDWLHQN